MPSFRRCGSRRRSTTSFPLPLPASHTSNQFLQWFVTEQVEEVDSMTTLLQTIKHSAGNLLLVEEFVRRTMQAAAATAPAA